MSDRNREVAIFPCSSERSPDRERAIVEALRRLGDRLFEDWNFDRRDFWTVREAAALIEESAREEARCNARATESSLVTPTQHRQAAEALRAAGWMDLARHHEKVAQLIERRLKLSKG